MPRHPKKISLREWLKTQNVPELAKTLDLDPTTLRQWRRGFTIPLTPTLVKLHALSGQAFDLSTTMAAHFSPKNTKRWKRKAAR